MKKPFLSILFLSLFSLGTKATTIYGYVGSHMRVITTKGDQIYFEGEHGDIEFYATQKEDSEPRYHYIYIVTPDTNEDYKQIKKMKNKIISKIPVTVDCNPTSLKNIYMFKSDSTYVDSEGIIHWVNHYDYDNSTVKGYAVLFDFVPSDIDHIYLHYGQGNN